MTDPLALKNAPDSALALPPSVAQLLRCPVCGDRLEPAGETSGGGASGGESLACDAGHRYPILSDGRPDLRLTEPITRSITHTLGQPPVDTSPLALQPLTTRPNPEVDYAGVDTPRHLTPAMLSHFPRASSPGQRALDLGCGRAIHRDVLEAAGYQYVGVDYTEDDAPILADAHALPLPDDSFDFVLCVAVLEHIRHPFVMIEQAARVMKPGAMLFGTVAFLEPWHDNSYFHHSHLGLANLLQHAGLEVQTIAPNAHWSVLQAQAKILFPVIPRPIARAIVSPLYALHRLWWLPIGWHKPRLEKTRRLKTAGAFTFIAVKP